MHLVRPSMKFRVMSWVTMPLAVPLLRSLRALHASAFAAAAFSVVRQAFPQRQSTSCRCVDKNLPQ